MKKTMCKILTLALAAMMICTNAFAAINIDRTAIVYDEDHDIATIPVTGLESGKEVAVLIVEEGTALDSEDLADSIVYIDQATASGTTLNITGVAAKLRTLATPYDRVDIYVGQEGSEEAFSLVDVKLNNETVYTYEWSTAPTFDSVQAGKASQLVANTIADAIVQRADGEVDDEFVADANLIKLTINQGVGGDVVAGKANVTVADVNTWIATLSTEMSGLSVAVTYDGNEVGNFALNIAAPATLTSIDAVIAEGTEVPINVLTDDDALIGFLRNKVTVTGTYSDSSTAPITGWSVDSVEEGVVEGATVTLTIRFNTTLTDTIEVVAGAEATAVGITGKVTTRAYSDGRKDYPAANAIGALVTASLKSDNTYAVVGSTTVGADGTFELVLPASGEYNVVVNYSRVARINGGKVNYDFFIPVAKTANVTTGMAPLDDIALSPTYLGDYDSDGTITGTDMSRFTGNWYRVYTFLD